MFSNLDDNIRIPLLTIFPITITLFLLLFVFLNWQKINFSAKLGWTMIIGGALGNICDRLFLQSVTDFMHFRFFNTSFFINNLADDFISIGIVFLLAKDLKILFMKIYYKFFRSTKLTH